MAVLYITEYEHMNIHPAVGGGGGTIAQEPPIAEQTVAIGGTSDQSDAFNNNTRFVRIHTDAICSIAFGTDPTAAATNRRLAAGQTEYFAVPRGYKVAVITNS